MKPISVHDVFVPNGVPTYTYVDRSDLKLERRLRDALEVARMVVSISGPSKSGKSVLIHKVIEEDLLINLTGASIHSAEDIWDQALRWMGEFLTRSTTNTSTNEIKVGGKVGGGAGIPLLAKASAEANISGGHQTQNSTKEDYSIGSMSDVIREIAESEYIIFIDDFHYIPRDAQAEVGKQIKAIVEHGVRICAASIPHRSDDVVRSNPELSGRIIAINIARWSVEDLKIIVQRGFPELNVDLAPSVVDRLAREAFGTPQLMQSLCLNLCLELNVREPLPEHCRVEVTEEQIIQTLERTSYWTDYTSVVQGLHSGPKERGTERKQFNLLDNSKGDVYRSVLVALCQDPPLLSFTYDQLMDRIIAVCGEERPVGSSVNSALAQMEKLSVSLSPQVPILEWDENVLEIVDPYFLFFLRSSRQLETLGRQRL
jgi:hypothetical protein